MSSCCAFLRVFLSSDQDEKTTTSCRTGAESNILFTFQYGGQIDVLLSDVFCFGAHISFAFQSYTRSQRMICKNGVPVRTVPNLHEAGTSNEMCDV